MNVRKMNVKMDLNTRWQTFIYIPNLQSLLLNTYNITHSLCHMCHFKILLVNLKILALI